MTKKEKTTIKKTIKSELAQIKEQLIEW